jgi:hypothetical protein
MKQVKMVGPNMKITQPVVEVIGRALMDEPFRKELAADKAKALHGYQLTPEEREVIDNIDHDALEAQAGKLTADASTAWAIYIVIRITF